MAFKRQDQDVADFFWGESGSTTSAGVRPAWFYKLDELIYQGYRQGMAISLLALDYLKANSRESFTFATDREFWKPKAPKPEMEVDLFCAPDGVFTVGEAKTQDSLGDGISVPWLFG